GRRLELERPQALAARPPPRRGFVSRVRSGRRRLGARPFRRAAPRPPPAAARVDDGNRVAANAARGDGLISVIISTYEHADALDVVLRAFADQDDDRFEVVVADDGSGDETRRVIDGWRPRLDISHVWHPNEGFRKARAFNSAALSARGGYLAF